MYKYIAVTRNKIENATNLLRQKKDGTLEQFDDIKRDWVTANEFCGIYSGDIECETITKIQADEIIKSWCNK